MPTPEQIQEEINDLISPYTANDQAERIPHWPNRPASGTPEDAEWIEAMTAWESAHNHDIRLDCYPEYGCAVIGSKLAQYAQTLLADNTTMSAGQHIAAQNTVMMRNRVIALEEALDKVTAYSGGPLDYSVFVGIQEVRNAGYPTQQEGE